MKKDNDSRILSGVSWAIQNNNNVQWLMKIAKSYILNGKWSCMVFPGIMCIQIKVSTKNENAIKQTKYEWSCR